MGNVSWVCPTIHPELSIADEGTPAHSLLFRDAAAMPRADETTLLASALVAQVAYELFADPELVTAAWREFETSSAASGAAGAGSGTGGGVGGGGQG